MAIETVSTASATPKKKSLFSRIGSRLGEFGNKALEVLDKPQQYVQSKLAPTLFGTRTYEQGFNKLGLNPSVSKGLALGSEMLLDPTNLIPVGAITKGLGTARKATKGLSKITPILSKLDEARDLTKIIGEGSKVAEKVVRTPNVIERVIAKIPALDKIVTPVGLALERTKTGAALSTRLYDYKSRYQQAAGLLLNKFNKIAGGIDEKIFEDALNFREGYTTKVSQQAKIIARQLDEIFIPVRDVGVKTKLGKFVSLDPAKYVPHSPNIEVLKSNTNIVKDFAKLNNLPQKSAQEIIDKIIQGHPIEALSEKYLPKFVRSSHLEKRRVFDFPAYALRRDKAMIADYINETMKRTSNAAIFGERGQELQKYFKNLRMEDPEHANDLIGATERMLGINPRNIVEDRQLGLARKFQTLTSLGTAGLSNLSQSVNTATKFGFGNTLKAMGEALGNRKVTGEIAELTGVVSEAALRDIMNEGIGMFGRNVSNTLWGKVDRFLTKIAAPGFETIELFNRRVAMNAGLASAVENLDKAIAGNLKAREALVELGIDVRTAVKKGVLSENDMINAARKAVEFTQFTVDPTDLPAFFSTPYGKVLTQFKSFSFKQGQFIGNEVLKKAIKEKDFMPLMRYLWLGNIVGGAVTDIKSVVKGRDIEEDPFKKIGENISAVGGAGMPQDALRALQGGTEQTLKWIVGPTVSDIATVGQDIVTGDIKGLGRFTLGNVPVVGSRLSKGLLPSNNQKKSSNKPLQPRF